MWNKWVLFMCLGIILFLVSYSYASNETDILNDTDNTVSINAPSFDLESDNYESVTSDIDNISIDYGEQINIYGYHDEIEEPNDGEHCNCTVYIDNKLVNFINGYKSGGTINMYNYDYYEGFLNSIFPRVGLHNLSIIFEFDTPRKYDVTIENNKQNTDYTQYTSLLFYFNVNDNSEAKKRYSYNTTLNILKKDKTVHITNISPFATYVNPLFYDVIVNSPLNSFCIIISNTSDIIIFDSNCAGHNNYYGQSLPG